jgi:hypothetical protein
VAQYQSQLVVVETEDLVLVTLQVFKDKIHHLVHQVILVYHQLLQY